MAEMRYVWPVVEIWKITIQSYGPRYVKNLFVFPSGTVEIVK